MLLWLNEEDKPKTVEVFDSIVLAEIPDPNSNRKLFNQCSKQFPKQFCSLLYHKMDIQFTDVEVQKMGSYHLLQKVESLLIIVG